MLINFIQWSLFIPLSCQIIIVQDFIYIIEYTIYINVDVGYLLQFGLTPSQTGLLFLTISLPYIIFASVGGQIADKIVRSV